LKPGETNTFIVDGRPFELSVGPNGYNKRVTSLMIEADKTDLKFEIGIDMWGNTTLQEI